MARKLKWNVKVVNKVPYGIEGVYNYIKKNYFPPKKK